MATTRNPNQPRGQKLTKEQKRKRAQLRTLQRLSLILLIAMIAARVLLMALDLLGIALSDILGANAFVILYASAFTLFGWKLRGWRERKARRKKSTPTEGKPQMNIVKFDAPAPAPVQMRKASY